MNPTNSIKVVLIRLLLMLNCFSSRSFVAIILLPSAVASRVAFANRVADYRDTLAAPGAASMQVLALHTEETNALGTKRL